MNPEIGDKLQNIMLIQGEAQRKHGYNFDAMTSMARTAYIKEYALHLSVEMCEMLMELPHLKPWKEYSSFADESKMALAREEFVDMLHFFMNIALALGFSANTLYDGYIRKQHINYDRQKEDGYKPCTAEGSFKDADIRTNTE